MPWFDYGQMLRSSVLIYRFLVSFQQVAAFVPGNKPSVSSTPPQRNITVASGNKASIPCDWTGNINTVTWYEGPFHRSDQENFTHTEVIAEKIFQGIYRQSRNFTEDKTFLQLRMTFDD